MNVVIFTGPTGGHFYPALAFAEAFKKKQPEANLLVVTSERGRALSERAGSRTGLSFRFLSDFPFPGVRKPDFLIRLPLFLLQLARAFWATGQILKEFEPDLVLGFGSYVAGPGVLLSWWRGIPRLIHEQNRKMGKANAWALRFTKKVALSFSPDENQFQNSKIVVTGLPLREALVRCVAKENPSLCTDFAPDRVRILILGGSQGSRALNDLWRECFLSFSLEEKEKLAVIHITGIQDYEEFKTMYLNEGVEALVYRYHEAMEELFPLADLAITRAGAGTLFELALFGLPALVIPYPYAGGHQELNARYFRDRGGIQLLLEDEAAPDRMRYEAMQLIHSKALREQMSQNLRRLGRPQAADELVMAAEGLSA